MTGDYNRKLYYAWHYLKDVTVDVDSTTVSCATCLITCTYLQGHHLVK